MLLDIAFLITGSMPPRAGRGKGRGRGRGKGRQSASQSKINLAANVEDSGADAGEPAEVAGDAGSSSLVKRAARRPAPLRKVALTLTSSKPSLNIQTRDVAAAQFHTYLHYNFDRVEGYYLFARSSNELPGMTTIAFPYTVFPDSYVAWFCIACYVAHICAYVHYRRCPVHFLNDHNSCYLAQAINILFVLQPEFRLFLRKNHGRFDPDSILGMLSSIVNAWSRGPTLAGVTFTEFTRVRLFLSQAESSYLAVRQSFIDPGLLFGSFEDVFSSTLELILFVVEKECHLLEGLGGDLCPCPRCYASSCYTVRLRCPECEECFVHGEGFVASTSPSSSAPSLGPPPPLFRQVNAYFSLSL